VSLEYVYAPYIRALLGTALYFYGEVVPKSRAESPELPIEHVTFQVTRDRVLY
jgi:hypothetical protein